MTFRFIAVFLIMILACGPAFSVTEEVRPLNYAQEVDIVFWQTLPFAALWGHFLERQLAGLGNPGAAANWTAIMVFAVAVSATNAVMHANKGGVINGEKDPDN